MLHCSKNSVNVKSYSHKLRSFHVFLYFFLCFFLFRFTSSPTNISLFIIFSIYTRVKYGVIQIVSLYNPYIPSVLETIIDPCLNSRKPYPRLRCQTENRYVQTVQTESVYVQTVPDGMCQCPDYRAFKTFSDFFVRSKPNMSRPSQTKRVYVQTFVRSCLDHRELQIKFVRSNTKVLERPCPDFHALTRIRKNYIMWRSAIP